MKMIISAGGTGGHIYPALAIVDKFMKEDKKFEVLYIGTHNRMENEIVPKRGIPYKALKIYGFSKTMIKRDIQNLGYIYNAYKDAIKIMKEFKPDIVVGVGGYVTFPVILAAKKLGIKSVIHEQNSIPGKTNKFLSKKVNAIYTSFKESEKYFSRNVKIVYTGNPSQDNVNELKPIKKTSLGFSKDKKLVLVTSGSLGSSSMNAKLKDFLNLVDEDEFEVLFVTGKANYDNFAKSIDAKDNIKIMSYLDNMAAIFKECDLVICRAGAGTIFELLNAKTPSILIPSPNVANNHQYYNAKDLSDSKLSLMIEEKNLDGKELYYKVKDLLKNNKEYKELKNNLLKQEKFSSTERIYEAIMEVVNEIK